MAFVFYEKISKNAAQITINRPAVLNALNFEAIAQFSDAVEQAHADRGLRALLLTGAGERAFCAGGDLKELAECVTEEDGRMVSEGMTTALNRLEALTVPTVAAINGLARGGGAEITLACDIRLMAHTASWGFTQISLAVTPGWGGGQRLLRTVGYSRAMAWLMEARVLSAAEAFKEGVVYGVFPSEDLLKEARAWVVEVSSKPPVVAQGIKALLRAGLSRPVEEAARIEAKIFPTLWAGKPHQKAVEKFLKRKNA